MTTTTLTTANYALLIASIFISVLLITFSLLYIKNLDPSFQLATILILFIFIFIIIIGIISYYTYNGTLPVTNTGKQFCFIIFVLESLLLLIFIFRVIYFFYDSEKKTRGDNMENFFKVWLIPEIFIALLMIIFCVLVLAGVL
jgi:hypothetical protein